MEHIRLPSLPEAIGGNTPVVLDKLCSNPTDSKPGSPASIFYNALRTPIAGYIFLIPRNVTRSKNDRLCAEKIFRNQNACCVRTYYDEDDLGLIRRIEWGHKSSTQLNQNSLEVLRQNYDNFSNANRATLLIALRACELAGPTFLVSTHLYQNDLLKKSLRERGYDQIKPMDPITFLAVICPSLSYNLAKARVCSLEREVENG